MTVPASKDFVSIGNLAAHLQRSVRTIEHAAELLQMAPALRLNGVPHFDGGQVERLIQAIHQLPQQPAGTLARRAAGLH